MYVLKLVYNIKHILKIRLEKWVKCTETDGRLVHEHPVVKSIRLFTVCVSVRRLYGKARGNEFRLTATAARNV